MKKIISAVLIIAMAASMAACGDSSKADESGDLIYGEVQSISGNDVVIHIAKYNGDKDDSDDASESDDTGSSSDRKMSRGDFKPMAQCPKVLTRITLTALCLRDLTPSSSRASARAALTTPTMRKIREAQSPKDKDPI